MAWVDSRMWSHPKFSELSDKGFRLYINSISYCDGYNTLGYLEPGQQRIIGSTPALRQELISRRVWDELGEGRIYVHDWDDWNGARDAQKAKDRERRREERARERAEREAQMSNGQSDGQSGGPSVLANVLATDSEE